MESRYRHFLPSLVFETQIFPVSVSVSLLRLSIFSLGLGLVIETQTFSVSVSVSLLRLRHFQSRSRSRWSKSGLAHPWSSWVFTSISRLRFPSFWGGRRRLCTLAHLVVSPPLMKLSMLRELRDLNSVVIIRELSPNTSSVSLTVRILFSEIMLWYDHDPAVTVSLDLTLLFPTLTV